MSTLRLVLPLAVSILLSGSDVASQTPRGPLHAEIDTMVKTAMERQRVPGASLLVAVGDKLIIDQGYGKANIEHSVAVTPKSVFRIGSITKQFTAAAILKLVDDGKLQLDDDWNALLPDFAFKDKKVTVRQLLNHTSGIKSFTGLRQKFRSIEGKPVTHAQLMALILDESFDFEPGEGFKYNNSGYYMLGMIIEKVSGTTYEEFLRERLYAPAKLEQTRYGGRTPIVPHRATGYAVRKGKVINAKFISMRPPFSAGALLSTTRDLHRWTRALHGGKVLSKKSYEAMITPVGKAVRRGGGYGYGLGIGKVDGEQRISHGGGIVGFRTSLAYYPGRDLTVALLFNSGSGNPGQLANRIASKVLAATKRK